MIVQILQTIFYVVMIIVGIILLITGIMELNYTTKRQKEFNEYRARVIMGERGYGKSYASKKDTKK